MTEMTDQDLLEIAERQLGDAILRGTEMHDRALVAEKRARIAEERVEALEALFDQFTHPVSTGRSPDGGKDHPEDDIMSIRIKMKTWFKMKILLREMDVEYIKNIMPSARPSDEFIQELEEFEKEIS